MRYLLILTLFLVACQPTIDSSLSLVDETAVPPRPTVSPEEIALGEDVYALQCAICHGVNLEGQPEWKSQNEDGSFRAPPHDAIGHTWHHGDPTLLEAIYAGGARFADMDIGGTSDMPAFGEILSDKVGH